VNKPLIKSSLPVIAFVLVGLSTTVYGQDSSGLKLGQPESTASENKLDLGAAPPASRQTPATSTEPTVAPTAGTGAKRTTYGDWEVACANDGSNCAMAQIGNDGSGTPVLEMVIRKLAEPLEVGERTAIAVLDVITPLGVVLVEGLSVKIDGGKAESAPFQICTEQGCLVREPVDNNLISRMKKGNNAVVSVIAANQGEVKATLSLSGFTKAFSTLK